MLKKRYARWMYDWETRLTMRDENRVVRPLEWGDKYPRLADAVRQEDTVRDMISGFLHQNNIEAINLLPALEADAEERDPYPHTDMHPTKEGYRVIADTINHYLHGAY